MRAGGAGGLRLTRSVTWSRCPLSLYSPASPTTSQTTMFVSKPPLASRSPLLLKRSALIADLGQRAGGAGVNGSQGCLRERHRREQQSYVGEWLPTMN